MAGFDPDSDNESDAMSISSLPSSSSASEELSLRRTASDSKSMRSVSPSSVWSISGSVHASAYRQEYGRQFNNYSDVYRLPADEEELDRLHKQHLMLMEAMGGKYCPPMSEVMEEDFPGDRKTCLDLGCGSGSWIMDVARDFPHCEAVALDLVPMQSSEMPLNCRKEKSEVDDVNLGLEHFYRDFNAVHTRLISSGIRDYKILIDQISRVLKPGGLIDVSEFDFHSYDQNYQRIELSTSDLGPPWWPRWLAFATEAARSVGGDVDAATHLYDWISSHPAFEEVVYREFWMSSSPWTKGNTFQEKIGCAMRDDILAFMKSGRPLLLESGHPERLVDYLQHNATVELMEAKTPFWIRLQCVFARKKRRYEDS